MRRAINKEMITNPSSISDNDLDRLIHQLSDEIQALFPDDIDAGALAYGKLSLEFRKGVEIPDHLDNDQIEDWLLGRAALAIISSAAHRKKTADLLASRSSSKTEKQRRPAY